MPSGAGSAAGGVAHSFVSQLGTFISVLRELPVPLPIELTCAPSSHPFVCPGIARGLASSAGCVDIHGRAPLAAASFHLAKIDFELLGRGFYGLHNLVQELVSVRGWSHVRNRR